MCCDDGLKADPAAGMSSATVMRISNCGMVIIKGTILDYYTIFCLYLVHLLHLIATIIAVSDDHDRDHVMIIIVTVCYYHQNDCHHCEPLSL